MKHIEKINQHIETVLEERGLHKSLYEIFNKHRLLSFKVWRLFSFTLLLPLSFLGMHMADNVFTMFSNGREVVGFTEHLLHFLFLSTGFFFPSAISTTLLTEFLPLYKLSQKSFFKKYLEKHFRKSTTIASSCDTMNYKEEAILKYSHDKELNLAMSSYYQYLLEFSFCEETKKYINSNRDKLLNIELNPTLYQKKFVNTVLQFIHDFYFFSTCPTVLKDNYSQEVLHYTDTILSETHNLQAVEEDLLNSDNVSTKEKTKKVFKDML